MLKRSATHILGKLAHLSVITDFIYFSGVINARDREKSYADVRRKPLEFQIGDKILAKVELVDYRLELPQQLSKVHSTFHVINLKKCLCDESLVIPLNEIQVDDKLHFVEEPVKIMDQEVKRLNKNRIPMIKVRGNSGRGLKFTWECEDQFHSKYPHLFTNTNTVDNTNINSA
ncbi:hypothetical protein Tco_0568227 [Tanacetum coccineum]